MDGKFPAIAYSRCRLAIVVTHTVVDVEVFHRVEGKNDVDTCATDESCQSKSSHEIFNQDSSPEVCVSET